MFSNTQEALYWARITDTTAIPDTKHGINYRISIIIPIIRSTDRLGCNLQVVPRWLQAGTHEVWTIDIARGGLAKIFEYIFKIVKILQHVQISFSLSFKNFLQVSTIYSINKCLGTMFASLWNPLMTLLFTILLPCCIFFSMISMLSFFWTHKNYFFF